MPLPINCALVTLVLYGFGDYRRTGGQSKFIDFCKANCIVISSDIPCSDRALKPSSELLISPSQQGGSGRTAFRAIRIMLRKTDTFFGKLIDVRRPDSWISVTGQVPVSEVIGHDEDNVWLVCLDSKRNEQGKERC